jgi:5-methylcytosine-specific restriction endonuclease McrA
MSARDGVKPYCKTCGRGASRAYHEAHAAEQNAKILAKYHADPRPKAAYDREYRAKNKARLTEYSNQRRERLRAEGFKRRVSDASKERTRKRDARRYVSIGEEIRARTALYRRANPEKHRAWAESYRARRAGGEGVSARHWLALRGYFGERCLACGKTATLTMDHVVPLSLGGAHDLTNVQLLCKSCNSRKQRRIVDYRPSGWEALVAELNKPRLQVV